MNALNQVEIKNTFRINAKSAIEAAKIAAPSHIDLYSVEPIVSGGFEPDSAFIVTGTIGTSVYHHVVFVDFIAGKSYRAEVGSVTLTDLEVAWYVGGDDVVNDIGFYQDDNSEKIVSTDELNKEIQFWIGKDKEDGTPGRMESYIKSKYKRVIVIDGEVNVEKL